MSDKLTIGFVGSSTKENEKRVAIHPAHFPLIDEESRKYLYVERGYGERFRIGDDEIEKSVAGLLEREELFAKCDAIMIFKPTEKDFQYWREGQVIWGALHLVQGPAITQEMIDKKITGIAMESMFLRNPDGSRGVWIFHTQSEFAGYCSVLHATQLLGMKGWHDQPKKVAVISFGGAGRGAVHAFRGLEFDDITVFTQRPPISVKAMIPTVKYGQYRLAADGTVEAVRNDGETLPFGEELSRYDLVVNCVLQDTDAPLMFVDNKQLAGFRKGSLFVDVSCDAGMGFEFTQPTTFDDPLLELGGGTKLYAVDHTPSLLYDTASLEHSKTAWPHVGDVIDRAAGWERNRTVGDAIEIKDGVVVNDKILTFQQRDREYPHPRRG
jgi:alanine dehydrogenase